MNPKVLIWISVVLTGVAQIFLKQGMINVRRNLARSPGGVVGLAVTVVSQVYVWLWGFCFVAALGLWLLGLQRVDLSYAYPLVSVGYVLVSLLAMVFFCAKIDGNRWTAIAVICVGVTLIAAS